MLRVIGLTLLVITGAAKVADAENRFDRPTAGAVGTPLSQSPISAHGVQLQIGGGLALAPAGQDRPGSLQFDLARIERQQRGREARRQVAGRNAQDRSDGWLNLGAGSKPTLAYSVTQSLSLGVDYTYQDGENMNFKVARVGGLEFELPQPQLHDRGASGILTRRRSGPRSAQPADPGPGRV